MNSRFFQLKTPTQGLSILVVDDNPLNRKLAIPNIKKTFSKENIAVLIDEAEDGLGAVDKVDSKIKKEKKNYDIIFMDREMPKNIDGVEATRLIKELEAKYNLPSQSLVIAWSASEERIKYGDAELPKPLNCNQMVNLFRNQHYLPNAPALAV